MNRGNFNSKRFKKNLRLIRCECGEEILLLPDLVEMGQVIEGHAQKHASEAKDTELAKAIFDSIQTTLIEQTLLLASKAEKKSKLTKSEKTLR